MGFQVDDSAKRRLTDPAEIDRAIQLLEPEAFTATSSSRK